MGQVDGLDEMADRGGVGATERQCLLDCRLHPLMSVRFDQAQHLNHLPGAALFAVPANQRFEQMIVIPRP